MIHTLSWSEIDCFRQCPFKHHLAYKQRWVKPAAPGTPLSRGSLWHAVLEAHYNGIKAKDRAQSVASVNEILGKYHDDAEADLVRWMYLGYVDYWGWDDEWEVVATEYANEFWLPTAIGTRSGFKLKMKIDLVVKFKGRLWIVDHKSQKNLLTEQMIEFDDQFGLYTWGLRQLGKQIHGAIHNGARTQRNKTVEQPLEERFKRTMTYRTDVELDTLAIEAYKTSMRAYGSKSKELDRDEKSRLPERNTNTDTCRWRCDFTEDCLSSRKGAPVERSLLAHGFTQEFERH